MRIHQAVDTHVVAIRSKWPCSVDDDIAGQGPFGNDAYFTIVLASGFLIEYLFKLIADRIVGSHESQTRSAGSFGLPVSYCG